jgi:NAD(P)-dependent dehydrogenase (short-subunit alcohol dehydrogenase family)
MLELFLMTFSSFDLSGKIAVVTGATGVLCSAICHGLADAGANLVVIARNQDKIDTLVKELTEKGIEAIGVSADVLDKPALQSAAEKVKETFGRIDILINGAGGNRSDATTMPNERSFFDLPEDALRWVFDLNFVGAVLTSQVFAKMMVEQKSGVILNMSSMASYQPMTLLGQFLGCRESFVMPRAFSVFLILSIAPTMV